MHLNCLMESKNKKMKLLFFITKQTLAAKLLSVKILASKTLIISKYTRGKASQARVLLKIMDLTTGQALC